MHSDNEELFVGDNTAALHVDLTEVEVIKAFCSELVNSFLLPLLISSKIVLTFPLIYFTLFCFLTQIIVRTQLSQF